LEVTKLPVVWSIAGSDSSAGAGSAADLKTMTALGVHGATVLTAVTAQGLARCDRIFALDPDLVAAQLRSLHDELPPAVIKIGMLATAGVIGAVANYGRESPAPVVCDPVLRTSSGRALLEPNALAVFRRELLPHVDLLTPNLDETAALWGRPVVTSGDVEAAADALLAAGCKAVLIKGGHERGEEGEAASAASRDFYADQGQRFWLYSERLPVQARGTGCTLAAAAAAQLAKGSETADAVVVAKAYVNRGLRLAYGTSESGTPRLLHHGPWPVAPVDMPWIPAATALSSPFPPCAPAELGFYQIVDRHAWLPRLVAAGLRTAQLRSKDLSGAALEAEIAAAVAFCRKAGVRLYINDHWRLALKHGAYGVHLGQEDVSALTPRELTELRESGMRLGISTHSYVEAARAHALRPSYVALGPILPTTCKSMRFGPQGFGRLEEWCRLLPYPVVAIGGLRVEHAAELRAAGAAGAAVISDVTGAADPEARLRAWTAAFPAAMEPLS
jgi:hydroxymethylpyrimidine kinase/phosphomethylpyrimidine kinase/thiamine-phosphate diphosphorylase